MPIRQVLWDWNGTLLDDLRYAIDVRNRTFPAFHLPTIDVERYREQFTFPVRLYYERAGVTDEIFDDVAHAWMNEYIRGQESVPLHPDTLEIIDCLESAGLRQVILSASALSVLRNQLKLYGLENRFARVLGLGDIYAGSKEAIGRAYLETSPVPRAETVMLGDTLHDAEVARAMGTRCALIARGHQSRATLESAGVPVFATLHDAAEWVLRENERP